MGHKFNYTKTNEDHETVLLDTEQLLYAFKGFQGSL